MSILPPSPFVSFTVSPGDGTSSLPSGESEPLVTLASAPGESAAASPLSTGTVDAAADLYGTGPCMTADLPIIQADNERTRQRNVDWENEHRFVLDEAAFLNDLEPLPAFLSAPSQEYLKANELMPVLHALAGH